MTIRLPGRHAARLRAYEPRAEPARRSPRGAALHLPYGLRGRARRRRPVRRHRARTRPAAVDWDATLAFRRHLWSHGLGVAEAMDTAQRGMGLDWAGAAELIRRSAAEAKAVGGRDRLRRRHRPAAPPPAPHAGRGPRPRTRSSSPSSRRPAPRPILMASRALAAAATGPEDYLERLRPPAAPGRRAGRSCTGSARCSTRRWRATGAARDLDAATDTFLEVIAAHPDKVDGIKVSLLDAQREVDLRRRLPDGRALLHRRRLQLPRADRGRRAAASATPCSASSTRWRPLAAEAVRVLDTGDTAGFRALLDPTVELSRHLFQTPDPLLQDGRGLPGLAGRPPVALHDGRRPPVGPLAAAPRARLRTRRRPRPVPGPGAGRGPDEAPARPCTESTQ